MRCIESKIALKGMCLLIVSCMACTLYGATFTVNTPELGDLTIVEADPYKSGDTPGNTLRVDGAGVWASTSTSGTDNLWRERAISAFKTGYDTLAGASDRVYEAQGNDRVNAPELVTTVTGLASSSYDVFLVHIYRLDTSTDTARLLGGLEADPTFICDRLTYVSQLGTATGTWGVGVTPLGTVVGDTITVYTKGTFAANRCDYVGLAYRYTPTAWNPGPADNDVDIETDATLSWNTGLDAAGAVNANITKHELYMVEVNLGEDPNMASASPVDVTGVNPTGVTPPITLNSDKAYYWRVDEVTNTETITGPVWFFETIKAIPSFNPPLGSQPESLTKLFVGEDVVLTATAGTTGGIGGTISYQWYYGQPGDTSNPVADEVDHINGAATNELTITVDASDHGVYFCRSVNTVGQSDSQAASILVKGLIAHYKFDDDLVDAVGGNNGTADPNFIEGIDGSAVELIGNEYIDLGTIGTPNSSLGGGLTAGTVSVWLNAPINNGFSFSGTYNDSDSTGFDCWYTSANNLAFIVRSASGSYVAANFLPSGNLTNNQWRLVTFTWDCETGEVAIYLDGLLNVSQIDSPISGFTPWENSMIIGGVNYPAGNDPAGPADFLTGALDDYRVYNYALNAFEAAQLYVDFNPEASFCVEKPVYDFNDDCKVDLLDIAEFAISWLECSLIPASACY
ncbi:MAG: LamG domain-containing protein [Anaerohalosphaera sp.]|nr:LamG domain-containing protein [Anaerohalosphaera sp.]